MDLFRSEIKSPINEIRYTNIRFPFKTYLVLFKRDVGIFKRWKLEGRREKQERENKLRTISYENK